MGFLDKLKAKIGPPAPEPGDDPSIVDTQAAPEPPAVRQVIQHGFGTAIVCGRGPDRGCRKVTLTDESIGDPTRTQVKKAFDDMRAAPKTGDQVPYPDRITQGLRVLPRAPWPPVGLAELVERLPEMKADEFPEVPFWLTVSVRVMNAETWLKALVAEITLKGRSARARLGSLQDELEALKAVLSGYVPCRRRAGALTCSEPAGHFGDHKTGEEAWAK